MSTTPVSNALGQLARDLKTPRFVHVFTVSQPREIEEETSRIEGDKTIVEKTKVTRPLNIEFGFKKLSRVEREDADLHRSAWQNRFEEANIPPQAIVLKRYANYGGILSEEQKAAYNALQRDFLVAETELKRLQVVDKDNETAIGETALRMVTFRQGIIDFQQEQAVFFANTSETKARQKLIEWLVLHLTYYRPVNAAGEPGDWIPFFAGTTTDAKLETFDAVIDRNDELWSKARDTVELLATIYASGDEQSVADVMEVAKQENAATPAA